MQSQRDTLNYNASRLVNFHVIRAMILGEVKERTVTEHTEHRSSVRGKAEVKV